MNWDEYFFGIAEAVSLRSKDPSTKVGCVITGPNNEIRSTGYNSFPRGIDDGLLERLERPEKYSWIEHAERNAIYAAARTGTPLDGCKIYVNYSPCMDCARAIVQSGIREVIGARKLNTLPSGKWGKDFERVVQLFEEAGVQIRYMCESTS